MSKLHSAAATPDLAFLCFRGVSTPSCSCYVLVNPFTVMRTCIKQSSLYNTPAVSNYVYFAGMSKRLSAVGPPKRGLPRYMDARQYQWLHRVKLAWQRSRGCPVTSASVTRRCGTRVWVLVCSTRGSTHTFLLDLKFWSRSACGCLKSKNSEALL